MENGPDESTCCVCLEPTERRGGKPLYSSGCCGCWLHLECAYSIARSTTCSKKCPLCRAQVILPYAPSIIGKRSSEHTGEEDAYSYDYLLPNSTAPQRNFASLQRSFLQSQYQRAGGEPAGSRAPTQYPLSPTPGAFDRLLRASSAVVGADQLTTFVDSDYDDIDDDDDLPPVFDTVRAVDATSLAGPPVARMPLSTSSSASAGVPPPGVAAQTDPAEAANGHRPRYMEIRSLLFSAPSVLTVFFDG
jgi:hypothetical protein